MSQLSSLLHREESYLFEDPWKAVDQSLAGALEDGTFSDLMQGLPVTLKMSPLDEYQTPTGKIELYSTTAEKKGAHPLPVHLSIHTEGYIFLNSATSQYTHTQFQDVHGKIPPVVYMNIEDARKASIHEGDVVELSNEGGILKLR